MKKNACMSVNHYQILSSLLSLAFVSSLTGCAPRRLRDSSEETVEELNARGGRTEERAGSGCEAEAQEPCQPRRRLLGATGAAARVRVCSKQEPRPDPFRYKLSHA